MVCLVKYRVGLADVFSYQIKNNGNYWPNITIAGLKQLLGTWFYCWSVPLLYKESENSYDRVECTENIQEAPFIAI